MREWLQHGRLRNGTYDAVSSRLRLPTALCVLNVPSTPETTSPIHDARALYTHSLRVPKHTQVYNIHPCQYTDLQPEPCR